MRPVRNISFPCISYVTLKLSHNVSTSNSSVHAKSALNENTQNISEMFERSVMKLTRKPSVAHLTPNICKCGLNMKAEVLDGH